MSVPYQEITKKLDNLVEEGVVDFFIAFKFDLTKNKLQEVYRKDPRDFFGKKDDSDAEKFARQIVKIKKIIQQMLTNPDFDNKRFAAFSTTLTHDVNLHIIVIQTQILFVATTIDFFSLMSKISEGIRENSQVVHESAQQKSELTQLLSIEKMILQRVEKLENLATMMIEVTKQFKEILEKR